MQAPSHGCKLRCAEFDRLLRECAGPVRLAAVHVLLGRRFVTLQVGCKSFCVAICRSWEARQQICLAMQGGFLPARTGLCRQVQSVYRLSQMRVRRDLDLPHPCKLHADLSRTLRQQRHAKRSARQQARQPAAFSAAPPQNRPQSRSDRCAKETSGARKIMCSSNCRAHPPMCCRLLGR